MSQKNAKVARKLAMTYANTEAVGIIRGYIAYVCEGSIKSRLYFAWRIITKKF